LSIGRHHGPISTVVARHSTDPTTTAPRLSEVQSFDEARQHRAKAPRRGLVHVSVCRLELRTYHPFRLRRSYAFQGPWALASRRFTPTEVIWRMARTCRTSRLGERQAHGAKQVECRRAAARQDTASAEESAKAQSRRRISGAKRERRLQSGLPSPSNFPSLWKSASMRCINRRTCFE